MISPAYRLCNGLANVQHVVTASRRNGAMVRLDQINDQLSGVRRRLTTVVDRTSDSLWPVVVVVYLHVAAIFRCRREVQSAKLHDMNIFRLYVESKITQYILLIV